ncbi:MAG TPA: hypothetical protein VK206_28560 [Anaerolineales bacterium]|nr:hypothetical protein [Anaerolineales bacterium]
MSKTSDRIASLIMANAIVRGNIIHTEAAESTRNINVGTYSEQLKISKSGTSNASITIKLVSRTVFVCQGTELPGFCRQL